VLASHPTTTLRGEAGLMIDPIHRRTQVGASSLDPAAPATRIAWALSARVHFGWEPTRQLRLFVAGGGELLLGRHDYVVSGTSQTAVVTPLAVRPRIQLGVAVNLP
jgi:hypothetical protein